MKFGTIGAGAVALAFARNALSAGHEVVLSNRHGPESLVGKVAELGHRASCAQAWASPLHCEQFDLLAVDSGLARCT
jgi:predicted dinucleotide-binding enzyme